MKHQIDAQSAETIAKIAGVIVVVAEGISEAFGVKYIPRQIGSGLAEITENKVREILTKE